MKPRLIILSLLLILISSTKSYGQETDKLIIKLAPLGLLEPYGQNIHLGTEFISKGPFSLETDVATYIKFFNKNENRIQDRIGIKIKPEIRYYFASNKPKTINNQGFYIANELYLTMDKFKRRDTFRHEALPYDSLYQDFEKIRRFIIGNNFKVGYQSVTKWKLTLDYHIGLGLQYYNATYDYDVPDEPCCRTMNFFDIPVYKKIRPVYILGIKLGYIL
jgi:hypothetical protein